MNAPLPEVLPDLIPVLEAFPRGAVLATPNGGIRFINRHGLDLLAPLPPPVDILPAWRPLLGGLPAGESLVLPHPVQPSDRWLEVLATPLPDAHWLVFFKDATRSHRSTEILAARARLAERFATSDTQDLLRATLDEAEALTGSTIGFYHFLGEDQQTLLLQAWSTRTLAAFCQMEARSQHYPLSQAGVWADAVRKGEPIIHNDYAGLPDRKGLPEGHAAVHRELVVTVQRNGKVMAVLGVGNKPQPYDLQDQDTVQRLADLAWDLVAHKLAMERIERQARELETSRTFFATLFSHNEAAMALSTWPEARMVDVNPAWERLTGCRRQEVVDAPIQALGIFPNGNQVTGILEDLVRMGESTAQELDIRTPGGQERTVLWAGKLAVIQDQTFLVSSAVDLTAQQMALKAMLASETKFLRAFQASPDAILLARMPEGTVLEGNQGFCQTTGYSLEEVLGISLEKDPLALWRDDTFWPDLRQRLSGGEVRNLERTLYRKGGQKADVLLSASCLDLEGGPWIILVLRDITEVRRAAEAHRELEAKLVRAQHLESLGSLAGGVAHDMNNVLGAILGMASAFEHQTPSGSPIHRAFETIARACERGRSLVQGLLGFARQDLAEEKPVDINHLVQEEVRLLERTTFQKVRLILDLAPALPPLQGDAGALSRMLMNLCVNAVDAMPEGGELTLRTRHQEGCVLLEVKDTGWGMAPEVLERAMDPFFTTKPHGKGTGLGLPLVYTTVKAHQGTVELRSAPGQGTQVTLAFPTPELPRPGEAPETSGAIPQDRSFQMLLVDDDDLVAESMEALLELLGHRSHRFNCGEALLAALAEGQEGDLLVLDMNMPGLGGPGTLPRVRQLRPDLPVLLSTGRADQSALDLAQAHGALVLPKPFTAAELDACIREMLT